MPREKILFTDWRDIQCGAVAWLTSDGKRHGVGNPPEPPVPMRAEPRAVPHGVRLVAQPARKAGMIENWKGWGRIISDEGRYRSWYIEINGHSKLGTGSAAHGAPPVSVAICGVESNDGFHWSEPTRSQIEVPGQRGFDGMSFFIDSHAPAEQRYKFIYCAQFDEGMFAPQLEAYLSQPPRYRDARISNQRRFGMFAAVSPDGVNWTALPEPFMLHPSDTDTHVLWNEELSKYVMYTRMFRDGRRWVGRAEADDFMHWIPVEPIIWPRLDDPPDYDFYLNGYSRYPGLPSYQLMLPMLYHRYTERSEVRLYSSADGIAWSQIPGGAILTPGAPGEWDCEFIGSGKDLQPFGEDKIAIPYSGTPYPHKFPRWQAVWDAASMGWAWWPKDRLCALVADYDGEFWTIPIVPAGREIRLNFRAPMAGEIRVGVEGVDGRSAHDCDPLIGDWMNKVVTWRGQSDIGAPEGQPVVLRVKLRCAELFSVGFE
ncbi:MAG: hypothetical protein O7E52_11085 [Candidatus Poribacteria bacterium]|nr:hypothetical protein [Candidatus Poribacteria bacterium]